MAEPQISILTGDLVGSTAYPPETLDKAMQEIRAAAVEAGCWQSPPGDTRFTRFRGDGWQIVLAEPHLSLRVAVVIQGRLIALGLETRISIGIGTAESLGTRDLADAAGPAFELSGRGLDTMSPQLRIAIAGTAIRVQDELITDLLSERLSRWTAAQAEAVALQLAAPARPRTLQEIGKQLNISPQAVNDRVRGAGGQIIGSVLRRWEQMPGRHPWSAAND